jgi:UDP-N-acetylglucosamine enolpyruvyl transferase
VAAGTWPISVQAFWIGHIAEGTSTIGNIGQIDRGYESIEQKLQALGADIVREQDNKN